MLKTIIETAAVAALHFSGPAPAAPVQIAAIEQPQAAQSQVVCRRYLEAGSKVKSEKICMTRLEWQKFNHGARDAMLRWGRF